MRTLTRENYMVTGTTSGVDAMDLALCASPSLVILDLNMPEPDGFETLKRLHAKMPNIKVIVVSGAIHGFILDAAILFGAVVALEKPIPPEMLLKTVERILAGGRPAELSRSAGKVSGSV